MVRNGKIAERHRIRRVDRDRFFEKAPRLGHIFAREAADMPMRAHRAVPGVELARVLARACCISAARMPGASLAGDGSRDLVLHCEYIGHFAVVAIRPQVMTAGGIDQLGGDPYPVAGPADAAFKHVANAEFARNLADIDGRTLVGECRIARDHEESAIARQRCDDVLDHAVSEIFLLGIAAHVLNGNTAIEGFSGSGSGVAAGCSGVIGGTCSAVLTSNTRTGRAMFLTCCSPRLRKQVELVAHLIAHDAADADAAGLSQSLQAAPRH